MQSKAIDRPIAFAQGAAYTSIEERKLLVNDLFGAQFIYCPLI